MAFGQPQEDSFLDLQLTFLRLGGILAPKTKDNSWKRKMYNVYCFAIIVWCPPSLVAQCIGMISVLDDVEVLTEILFEVVCAINTYFVVVYLTTKRDEMQNVIDKIQNGFKECVSNFSYMSEYHDIILSGAKRNVKYSRTVMCLVCTSCVLWVFRPVICRLLYEVAKSKATPDGTQDNITIDLFDNSTEEIHWDLFTLRMWLPSNPMEPMRYMLIWIFQIFPVFLIAVTFIGYNSLYYAATIFVSSHFKVLSLIMQNVNDIIGSEIIQEPESGIIDNNVETLKNNEKNEFVKMENKLEEKQSNKRDIEVSTLVRRDVYKFLKNCVKYHQDLLSLCDDIEDLYSPLFFVFFISNLGTMCTTIFRVTTVNEDPNFAKFISALLSVWLPMYLLCSCGEMTSSESVELGKTAYACNWYHSTTPVKQLLSFMIMRSQKPVVFSAGKLFPVNLEGFSAIANNVYAYYTILRNSRQTN